jgi:hypothetical protein
MSPASRTATKNAEFNQARIPTDLPIGAEKSLGEAAPVITEDLRGKGCSFRTEETG